MIKSPQSTRCAYTKSRLYHLAWAGVASCFLLSTPTQSAQTLQLNAQQIRAAGIKTERPKAAQAEGKQMVLNGYFSSTRLGTVAVSSLESSTVSEVLKDSLSEVKKGEPVLRIMSESWLRYQQEHLQNNTTLSIAHKNSNRDKVLLDEGLIPQRRFDDTQAQLTMAMASYESSRQRLKLMGTTDSQIRQMEKSGRLAPSLTILAPANGSLNIPGVAPGKQIDAGGALFQIIKAGSLELILSASPEQAQRIRPGQTVTLKECTGQNNNGGSVIGVSPLLSEGSQSVSVRVGLGMNKATTMDCYKLNQYTQATVHAGSSPSKNAQWLVPTQAVVMVGSQAYVFSKTKTGFDAIPVEAQRISTTHQIVQADQLGSSSELAISGTVLLKGTLQGLGSE